MYSDRSYKKFEQVFINYGEKSNADLLLLYGFSLDRNVFNSVDISVGLSKDDPLFLRKKEYLDKSGIQYMHMHVAVGHSLCCLLL